MEKELTIEEIFCGMPELLAYFREAEEQIGKVRKSKTAPNRTRERICRQTAELLETARTLVPRELKIVYYLRHLKQLGSLWFYCMLRDMYQAECDFKNECLGREEFYDIWDMSKP